MMKQNNKPYFSLLLSFVFFYSSFVQAQISELSNDKSVDLSRVVALGYEATEILLKLSPELNIVATDSISQKVMQGEWVNLGYIRQISTEGVLSQKPSMIFSSQGLGPDVTKTQLQQLDIPFTLLLSSRKGVDALIDNITQIADVIDVDATPLIDSIKKDITDLQAESDVMANKKGLYLSLQKDKKSALVAGNHNAANDLIELIQALNPAKEKVNSYQSVGMESILAYQPDFILIAKRHFDQFGGVDALLKENPILLKTQAGKSKAIFAIESEAIISTVNLKTLSEAKRLQSLVLEVID